MKTGKGKRSLAELLPISSPDKDDIPKKRTVVWISNDNGDPRSPLSIERLPQRVGKRISKVAHVKPRFSVISKKKKKKKGQESESCLPFFIDKTPTRVQEAKLNKKRRKDVIDTVVVPESPCSSHSVQQGIQPARKYSIDTIDLCSESEEEHVAPKRKSKPKKKITGHTSKKLNENDSGRNSPDIIILDDEDESTNNRNNSSIIVESISNSSVSMPSLKKTNETCSTTTGTSSDRGVTLPSNCGVSLTSNCFPPFGSSDPITCNASNFLSTYSQHTTAYPSTSFGTTSTSVTGRSNLFDFNAPFSKNFHQMHKPSALEDFSDRARRVFTEKSENSTSTSVTDRSNLFNYNPPLSGSFHQMHKPSTLEDFSDRVRRVFTEKSENSVLTSSVGSNIFNPNGEIEQTGLRPIIIDGCNVAIAHGGNRIFSVRGLCICVEYFLRRGHTHVLALVPLHHRSRVSPRDRDILDSLQRDKHLVYTPSRYIDHRLISSYDDRYIVQYAAAVGGVVVSRDNYRDLLDENPAWKDTILNRLLIPTWVGDMLMFPVDPLGKKGPTLDEFLRFPN